MARTVHSLRSVPAAPPGTHIEGGRVSAADTFEEISLEVFQLGAWVQLFTFESRREALLSAEAVQKFYPVRLKYPS